MPWTLNFYASASCPQAPASIDTTIRPAPDPPLTLPAAGGTFLDPTYGTTILRVTDRTTAAQCYHAYTWSAFNSDNSYFMINTGGGWQLYNFNGAAMTSSFNKTLVDGSGLALQFLNGRWHPTNPAIMYVMENVTTNRKLWSFNVDTLVATLVHDFTSDMPTGGYPFAMGISTDGRYFSFATSSTAGQDAGDYVCAYDIETDTAYVLDFATYSGFSTIHSVWMDRSGQYFFIQRASPYTAGSNVLWIWDYKAGTTPQDVLIYNSSDQPTGHATLGYRKYYNGDIWNGGVLLSRDLSSPHTTTTSVVYPTFSGDRINWLEDHHLTHDNSSACPYNFFQSSYLNYQVTGWTLESGRIYQRTGFTATLVGQAPDQFYHNGITMAEQAGTPTDAGQWYFNSGSNVLYAWLFNSATATDTSTNVLVPFAWTACMEEIIQLYVGDTNQSEWRRLAHHHAHWNAYDGYLDTPRLCVDMSGQYVMFDSAWGGTNVDVFIVKVP